MRRMIVIAFFQQLAVLSSAFMQLHGLLYLFLLYRKRNIDLLVTHFGRKRNLIVKKCKELKLRGLRRKQRTRWVNDGRTDQWWRNMFSGVSCLNEIETIAHEHCITRCTLASLKSRLTRQTRLHGKISARLAGIPAPRYRDLGQPGWPGCHVIAKLIFVAFNKRAEIAAN